MATNQPGTAAAAATREYIVRVPKGIRKKCSVLKFNPSNNVDFNTCGTAKLERENNLREYKISHDMDMMPKYGAGSEYGREEKDEARRKKYGIIQKKYNPDDQPWLLKLGGGKQTRKFKGSKEGGVLENASYYIFTQCADGAFEAMPLKEWYNFMPVIKYKYLNADEAEEEFLKRDRTMNYFSVMLQKRLKGEDLDDPDGDEDKKGKKSKKKRKDFKLTEMDEWADLTDDEESEEEEREGSGEDKPKKKEPKEEKKKKKKPKKERDTTEEASEDSDDLSEGQEVDYMTDTDSDDEDMFATDTRQKSDKYEDKGVEDEEGLRKVIESGDEDEEEEQKNEEDEKEEDEIDRPKRQGVVDSDSESSDSGSDSDPEKDSNLSSALFMQKKDKPKSRSATPTGENGEKSKKRKNGDRDSPLPKKAKTENRAPTPQPTAATTTNLNSTDGKVEDAVRRYLQRKPMTIKDLLQKLHKNTGINKETLTGSITNILKRINPERTRVQEKLHFFIKKVE